MSAIPSFENAAALADWLRSRGVPIERWTEGGARGVPALFLELQKGECSLQFEPGSAWVNRSILGVHLDITHRDAAGLLWRLVEDRRLFADGHLQRRQLQASIGEKMTSGEEPEAAAYRALSEELGIEERLPLRYARLDRKDKISQDYPGLFDHYRTHRYEVELPLEHVRLEYVEVQPEKTSFWLWRPGDQPVFDLSSD